MRTNELKQTRKPTPRHKLMAMIHIAAQQLNIEHGGIEYRAWLQNLTGKTSCKDLTDEQLRELIALLRQQGCLERKTTGSAPNRPTQIQWRKMEILARRLGFGNAMTPQFAAFVKRVTKLESPRFLTKKSISSVIIGLEKWLEYKKKCEATKNINQTCLKNTVKRALILHENEKEYDGLCEH
ncbi:MAG TPA: regulatory protein GemA [Gammaproteobacteria bacterium]|jgi:hypothetical protein|nr:regulatory protein GemA [Gammaproteobacteria bacterium]